jgi:hypothetical protein
LERENKELIEELSRAHKVVAIQQTEITEVKEKDQELLYNGMMLEREDNKFQSTQTDQVNRKDDEGTGQTTRGENPQECRSKDSPV